MRKCPFCDQIINPNTRHIYYCENNKEMITKKEKKFRYIIHNFPILNNKELLIDLYINKNYSLPDIKNKYQIDYKGFLFLLDYFEIKKRTHLEGVNQISINKIKKSCLLKYGTINALSKGTPAYNKKRETFLKKYGVDNPFKVKEICDKFLQNDDIWMERYGLTRYEHCQKRGKIVWSGKTDEQKNIWLNKSIYKNRHNNKIKGIHSSLLETRINNILIQTNLTYTTQFLIKTKSYDFYINDLNLILEINGDYWHCNPIIYNKTDLIKFPYGLISAQSRWDKDKIKYDLAIKKGYDIIYIWEKDIKKQKTEKALKAYLYERIHNHEHSGNTFYI